MDTVSKKLVALITNCLLLIAIITASNFLYSQTVAKAKDDQEGSGRMLDIDVDMDVGIVASKMRRPKCDTERLMGRRPSSRRSSHNDKRTAVSIGLY